MINILSKSLYLDDIDTLLYEASIAHINHSLSPKQNDNQESKEIDIKCKKVMIYYINSIYLVLLKDYQCLEKKCYSNCKNRGNITVYNIKYNKYISLYDFQELKNTCDCCKPVTIIYINIYM
jgi:hypothetical protein